MKKLLSVVLCIFVAGAFPAATLAAGESYSLAPWVEDSSRSYLLSRNAGPTTHAFDGVAESIGESRYGPVGGTLYVEEDSFSVVPGIDRYVVEVTALDVAGYPTPWVNYQWAGIGLIRWRLDVGSTYGGTNPINFDSPVEVVDSGYSVFDRMGNWLGDYELYADTSTATSLSGVAIHSNGGQDIAGVDLSTIQMWWDVRQPDAASPPTVVTSAAGSIGETAALLNGTANPNGASTSVWFQWGTTSGYGNTTAGTNVGSGTSPVSSSSNLSALQCGTTYHFRAVAQNSGGAAYGSDRSFTTSACPTPPPTVVTSPAGSIGETAALLSGTANPNGASTSAWFQWGTTSGYGNTTAGTNVGSGTSPVSSSSNLSALQCGTTYYFRAVAQNSGGTAYGTGRAFTTSACSTSSPTVVTSPASSISGSGARLNGSADPKGASTNAWFEWGTTTGYGNVTSPQTNVGLGTSAISYGFNLGALACGTTYYFRAVAMNSGGTAYGTARTFTTSGCSTSSPTVVTSPASNVSASGARLNGSANPNGAATSAWFQWGTSTAYGNATAGTNVGSGTSPASYSSNLSALQCGTTYHFRAVAQNSGGTAYGSDRSFTTSACSTPPPTVVTSPASSVSASGARLNGSANPNGAATSAWFQWGTTSGYGNTTAGTNVGSGTSPVSYSSNLSALQCGTTYHFRAVAQNSGGAAYGSDRSFTTSACTGPVEEEVILEYGFETGSTEGWKSKGQVSIDGILAIGQYSLRHGNGAESVFSVMTAGYQDVSVTMDLAATSLGSGDACFAEVSTDGGDSWMPVVTLQNGEDTGAFYSGTVFPPGADDNVDVQLRFSASGRGNKGYCYGDEVYVMGTPIGG